MSQIFTSVPQTRDLSSVAGGRRKCRWTPQPALDRKFTVINALQSVSASLFNHANIFDQTRQSSRFDGSRLIAAPHRTVQRDVPLDIAGAQRNSGNSGGKPDLMA